MLTGGGFCGAWQAINEADMTAVFQMEEIGGEDNFAPMQPWQRIIVAPSKPPEEVRQQS
jgi:hypothetical protein